MMTKNEEKQTLEKIEKLIASAGPDSYIGMAFEGCVEMAWSNIENDFGNSPRQSIVTLRNNLHKETEARKKVQATNDHLMRKITELEAKRKQIPASLYKDLWSSLDARIAEATKEIEKVTELLAYCADDPESNVVIQGLKKLKAETAKRNEAKRIMAELEKYETK
jgi:hypothetical protein